MRSSPFWWILIGFMILLDFYFFQGIKILAQNAAPKIKSFIYWGYWVISVSAIILLFVLPYLEIDKQARFTKSTLFAIVAGIFFAKLIASVFFLVDDVRRGIQWIAAKVFYTRGDNAMQGGESISRSVFLSWIAVASGSGLFASLVYGFGNKYRYQLVKKKLKFSNLPVSFRGLKVVHISDIHSGSFTDKEAVLKGVEKIMDQQPDLILFTGDLVNNMADEMKDYMDVFNRLSAPMGVYSVLGNHDYGDYINWGSADEKKKNLERLKGIHGELGWKLLLNEHVVLQRGEDQMALLGVENWSNKGNFKQYGDLEKAYSGSSGYPFKILLSHDPSHWSGEVITKYRDIDLVLSGHTHGMQFGVEIPGIKWSPVQYVYPHWAGLYEKDHQKLYVNRGYGFIGYPGRVGILPEITVLEIT